MKTMVLQVQRGRRMDLEKEWGKRNDIELVGSAFWHKIVPKSKASFRFTNFCSSSLQSYFLSCSCFHSTCSLTSYACFLIPLILFPCPSNLNFNGSGVPPHPHVCSPLVDEGWGEVEKEGDLAPGRVGLPPVQDYPDACEDIMLHHQ